MSSSPKDIADLLIQHYGLKTPDVSLVIDGANTTFSVRDGGQQYYVRVYRQCLRTEEQIDFELRTLAGFPTDVANVSVCRPLLTKSQSYRCNVWLEGIVRSIAVFTSVGDKDLTHDAQGFSIFGKGLSILHRILPECNSTTDSSEKLAKLIKETSVMLSLGNLITRQIEADVKKAGEIVLRNFKSEINNLPTGVCHGDARVANAKLQDGRIGFFDFEDCFIGPRLFDLGTLAFNIAHLQEDERVHLWKAFANSYAEETGSTFDSGLLSVFVAINQIRAINFLAGCCALDEGTWTIVRDRAGAAFSNINTDAWRV